MREAKDYIVFPLDVASEAEARGLVELLAGEVGMFKVGLELFVRCGPSIVRHIHAAGPAGVFLDLKLHDIPETVSRAMAGVAALGVRLATVHCGESPRMLAAAVAAAGPVGVLGITVLTSVSAADIAAGRGVPGGPDATGPAARAAAHAAGCAGIVCSGLEVAGVKARFGREFLAVTPGIRPAWAGAGRTTRHGSPPRPRPSRPARTISSSAARSATPPTRARRPGESQPKSRR